MIHVVASAFPIGVVGPERGVEFVQTQCGPYVELRLAELLGLAEASKGRVSVFRVFGTNGSVN